MKICVSCKLEKPREEFTPYRGRLYSYCRACSARHAARYRASFSDEHKADIRRKTRERAAAVRLPYTARLNSMKSERPCYDCGGSFHPEAMEFDHVGPKSFELTKGYLKEWDEVRREIDKCQLVCANCHRVRTHQRRKQNEH